MENAFVNRTPVVEGNLELREPQREGYLEIANQVAAGTIDREVGRQKSRKTVLGIFHFTLSSSMMILFPMRLNYAFVIYLPTDSAEEPFLVLN